MITAHVEPYQKLIVEIRPVLPAHYDELSLHKPKGFALDPCWERYDAKDALGGILTVAIRSGGKLAGYFIGLVDQGLHYRGCLTLHTDIFYVCKEYRGSGGGKVLFDEVVNEARRRGVDLWMSSDKEHAKLHADKLHYATGFEKAENVFVLWMKG